MKKLFLTAAALSMLAAGTAKADHEVAELNDLVGGEISAVETYNTAIKKVENVPGSDQLISIKRDHEDAVKEFQGSVAKLGGQPAQSSGAWGVWAQTVTKTSNLFGDKAALKALKEGEEHGINEYKEALNNEHVRPEIKEMIRDRFIPNQEKHIDVLNVLMAKL